MRKVATLRPVWSRLQGGIGDFQSISSRAKDCTELAPGFVRETLPYISLPHELDRVRDVSPGTSLAEQISRLASRAVEHRPTVSYLFEDVYLAHGKAYTRDGIYNCGGTSRAAILFGDFEEIAETALCSSYVISRYFGHWLRDGLTGEKLAAERSLLPLTFRAPEWQHEAGYRALTGLKPHRVVRTRAKKLWITDDRGLNEGWAARWKALRELIRSAPLDLSQYIFLERGNSGAPRILANSAPLKESLMKRGFKVVAPELMAATEVSAALNNARIVVSVEGSAINHAQISAPPGSALLVIQPPNRFEALHKATADCSGIRFAFIVGEEALGGFTVDIDRLHRLIDLVEAAL